MLHQIKRTLPVAFVPSEDLYNAIRAALVARGTSLNAWCNANHINRQTAEKALTGQRRSKRADELRTRLIAELLDADKAA